MFIETRKMTWLVLLVLAGLAMASDLKLGNRIVATERECERIFNLNKEWSADNDLEQTATYLNLYLICIESLNEQKYAYIDENKVDMSWYPKEDDPFPIETSEGQVYVAKPPPRKAKEEEIMKKRMSHYLTKTGGMINIMSKLINVQDDLSQMIVDLQVECDALVLFVRKHPDDAKSKLEQAECIKKLNCLKEDFMNEHKYTKEQYPDSFPILYKKRGSMIKSPPKFDKSICIGLGLPEDKKLDSVIGGFEHITHNVGEKIVNIGQAGADVIRSLVQKAIGGDDKVLTKEDLDGLLKDAESVAITEGGDEEDPSMFKVYEDVLKEKLATIEEKGLEAAINGYDRAKPVIDTAKSKLEGLKEGISLAEVVGKLAASKVKQEGSDLINRFMPQGDDEPEEENLGNSDKEVLKTLIDHMNKDSVPEGFNDSTTQPGNLAEILKHIGGNGGNEMEMSPEEIKKTLDDIKEKTKQKAEELNLSKEEIRQSADVVKGVMHALLSTANNGLGTAEDISEKEIEKAKALVDELVNYATAEVLGNGKEKGQADGDETSKGKEDVSVDDTVKHLLDVNSKTNGQEKKVQKPEEISIPPKTGPKEGEVSKKKVEQKNKQTADQKSKQAVGQKAENTPAKSEDDSDVSVSSASSSSESSEVDESKSGNDGKDKKENKNLAVSEKKQDATRH